MKKERLLWSEYEYPIPDPPKDKTEIMFHDLPKKDQHWRKPYIPTDAHWPTIDIETRYKFVERERERRKKGVFFYNNGVITYITGKHYDHLVYGSFDYVPKYLDTQRHDFYFRDLIEKDPNCYGGLIVKPRRYGYTDMEVTDHICVAIDNFFANCGLMSNTRDKVYSTLYDKITASYLKRPQYVRPDVLMRNGLIPRRKMEFQSGKVTKSKGKNTLSYNVEVSMNSKIVPKSTSVMGYDGDKLKKLTLDEIWKWQRVSPIACWDKQKKCLFAGGVVIGKAMLLSTMGDDESYETAIREGISMWHDSSQFDRDQNGFTKTGLYRYFVPGWASLFDLYCDKYGYIDIEKATQYIMNERDKYEKGSLEYTYECRRFPLTIEEALGTALTTGVFDKDRIVKRIEIIKGMSNKPYLEGKLTEDNNGRVHFEEDSNEPWVVYTLPYRDTLKNIDRSNRFRLIDGKHIAPRNPEGVFGYDPIRYADIDTKSDSLSKASIMGRYKYDYFRTGDDNAAGRRSGFYLDRPPEADEGHYEAIKAAKFWGFMIQPERQVETFIKLCRQPDIQMTDFVLRGSDGLYGIWADSQRKVLKNGIDAIVKRFKPKKEASGKDWLDEEVFIAYLEQLATFNPKYPTKFDAVISDIMCEDGLTRIHELLINNEIDMFKNYQIIVNKLFPKRR